jgi:CarD family transcriptional regulator
VKLYANNPSSVAGPAPIITPAAESLPLPVLAPAAPSSTPTNMSAPVSVRLNSAPVAPAANDRPLTPVTLLPSASAATPLPAARPPELAVGDWAVYPSQGVVQVVSIDTRDIAGSEEPYYGLRATEDGTRLFVPVRRLTRSGLRRLIGLTEVPNVMATLRATPPPRRPPSYKWHQILFKKVNTGSLVAIAEVLRDLSHVKNQRPLSATERHILDSVEYHLVTELSLVTGRTPESFIKDLARIFRPRS